jgi:DNA-binding transcriptional ArsR family regulator
LGPAAGDATRTEAGDSVSEAVVEPPSQVSATRTIDSAEAIKAIADPLRLQLLQLLMIASDRTWSVKEMAAELGQPVTKLYHHVKLLHNADLIADVETRVVSGIVEHRYRANQKGFRLDDSLFAAPELRHDAIAEVSALLDATRDDLLDYLYREDADFDQVNISKSHVRLTPEEIDRVKATVEALLADYAGTREDPARAALPLTSILVLLNPRGHDPA